MGRAKRAQRRGSPLEVSGINKLFALAQELGVREANNVPSPEGSQPREIDPLVSQKAEKDADPGLKVSLSAAATRLADALPASEALHSTSSSPRNELELPKQRIDSRHANSRRGAGIAAYERNGGAIPGERIQVIA